VVLLDRERLEGESCACCRIVREEYDRMLRAPRRG
jgi:hypothetical protein